MSKIGRIAFFFQVLSKANILILSIKDDTIKLLIKFCADYRTEEKSYMVEIIK